MGGGKGSPFLGLRRRSPGDNFRARKGKKKTSQIEKKKEGGEGIN